MPRVSVVIPAFNAAQFIAQTLESVLKGSYSDIEIIVIDDGSADTTSELASRYSPVVKVIRQENSGMSRSRNRGVQASDSEFVALLDSDDVWHSRKLEFQVELLRHSLEFDLCYTGFTLWDGGSIPEGFNVPPTGSVDQKYSGWIYHLLLLTNWVLPSSLLLRRSAWNALGGFVCQNQKTDDWEFIVRASRSHRFIKVKDSMVLYRQTPGSLSRRVETENSMEKMRGELIARYGLASPDGTSVDISDLNRRRYRSRRDFADANCARGDLKIGLREFASLMLAGGHRIDTALHLAKALRRRALRSSGQITQ